MRGNNAAIGYICLVLQITAFLAMGLIGRSAAESASWQSIVTARTCVGALALLAYSAVSRTSLPLPTPAGMWPRSIVGAVGLQFTFYALTKLPLATSISVFRSSPVWTAMIAWFFLGTRLSGLQRIAIAVTVAGVLFICHPSSGGPVGALLCAFVSSILVSVAYVLIHKMRDLNPVQVVVHSSSCAAMTSILVLLATDDLSVACSVFKDSRLVVMLILVGLLGAAGQILMTISCRSVSPVVLSTAGLVEVPLSLLIGAYSHRVTLTVYDLIGAFMICVGAGYLVVSSLPPVPDRLGKTIRHGQTNSEESIAQLR